MTTEKQGRSKIVLFLLLTAAFGSLFYYLIITGGGTDAAGGGYVLALMWAPGVAALLTRLIVQRNLRGFGWKLQNVRLYILAYLLPLLYGALIYGLVWLTGLGGLNAETLAQVAAQAGLTGQPTAVLILVLLALAGTVNFAVFALPGAIGEELGWRGLLVPELAQRMSFTKTALLSGVIWVIYHAPVIIWSDYNSGAPTWYALSMFGVAVISISFVYAWLRLRSGSVWTAVILHASHNVFILGFFDPLMLNTGVTNYITTEFGVGLALVSVLLAVLCWRRRDAVEVSSGASAHGVPQAAAGALTAD